MQIGLLEEVDLSIVMELAKFSDWHEQVLEQYYPIKI